MSILISILVELLVSFLSTLIQRWLDNRSGVPTFAYLEDAKPEFLQKVKWRFWLGPKRMQRAEKAYDLALARYDDKARKFAATTRNSRDIASEMIKGIGLELE